MDERLQVAKYVELWISWFSFDYQKNDIYYLQRCKSRHQQVLWFTLEKNIAEDADSKKREYRSIEKVLVVLFSFCVGVVYYKRSGLEHSCWKE